MRSSRAGRRPGSRGELDDALRLEPGDRRRVITQFAQHFVSVLTLVRGRAQPVGLRLAAHMDRLADDLVAADLGMVDGLRHAEMLYLRVFPRLVDRVDRAARDTRPVER